MSKLHPRRTVDLAADHLREAVLSGRYAAGTKLPAERQLSQDLGISRLTLRAALAQLQTEGLVEARQGSGVVVLDYRTCAGVSLLPHLLQTGDLRLLRPFLELRRAVAVEAVAGACTRASDESLDELGELADALCTETDPRRLAEGNLAFSRRVLQLADNLPMELLFNTVTRVYRLRPELREALHVAPDAIRASFPAVVAVLRARDPDLARRAVRQSLEAIDEATLASLEIQ